MSLLFNMLSRFVIAFLRRNKCLFISWLKGNDKPLQYLFLPQEPHKHYEKTKTYDTGRWVPSVGRCPICYWGKQRNTFRKNKMWVLEYKYYYLALRVKSFRCIWNMSIHYILHFKEYTIGCYMESGLQGIIVGNACKTFIVVLREMGEGDIKLGPWVIIGAMSMTVTI